MTLLREDGTATYQLASVVDDIDFGITHVIRGNDHRPNEALHRGLARALGAEPPEYLHHGLILGADGKKMSKRAEGGSIAALREEGIPPEAVRGYLEELGIPKHDVHLDLARIRSLSVDVIAELTDDELAGRVGVPVAVVPALRGAHDLNEARRAGPDDPRPDRPSRCRTSARRSSASASSAPARQRRSTATAPRRSSAS